MPTRMNRPRAAIAITVAAVVIVAAAVAITRPAGTPGAGAAASRPTLLVLPFANLTGDSTRNYLADGLTEELITTLVNVAPPQLRVIARTTSLSLRNDPGTVAEIAGRVGATHVLQGAVAEEGGTYRITTRLIELGTMAELGDESYQRDRSGMLRLPNEMVEDIGAALAVPLDRPATAGNRTNAAAEDAFMRGSYYLRRQTIEGTRRALPYLNAALLAQHDYADALAALGEANFRLGQSRLAREATNAALAIDPEHGEANRVMGNILLYEDWDFSGALERFAVAERRRPTPLIRQSYAVLLAYIGRGGDAVAQLQAATEEDPLSVPLLVDAGRVANMLADHRGALERCGRALDLAPRTVPALDCITRAYLGLGITDSAMAYARRSWIGQGRDTTLLAPADAAPEVQLRTWRQQDLDLLRARSQGSAAGVPRARLHLALGDTASAIQLLQGAVFTRQPAVLWLGVDPAFDALRGTPLFKSLIARIGFPQ